MSDKPKKEKPADTEPKQETPQIKVKTTEERVEESIVLFSKLRELPFKFRLNQAMKHVGTVSKDGYNTHHNYSYATASDSFGQVKQALVDYGIVLLPTTLERNHSVFKISTRNGHMDVSEVKMRYRLEDCFSAEHYEAEAYGIGSDTGDKGLNKAYTVSLKYFLNQVFLIATKDDDPESQTAKYEGRVTDGPQPKRGTQQPSQRPPQKSLPPGKEPPQIPLYKGNPFKHELKTLQGNQKVDGKTLLQIYVAAPDNFVNFCKKYEASFDNDSRSAIRMAVSQTEIPEVLEARIRDATPEETPTAPEVAHEEPEAEDIDQTEEFSNMPDADDFRFGADLGGDDDVDSGE